MSTIPISLRRLVVQRAGNRWEGVRVVGLTATGRATIDALCMNRLIILSIRAEEELLGRHPPPSNYG
jgi:hypothetical protein